MSNKLGDFNRQRRNFLKFSAALGFQIGTPQKVVSTLEFFTPFQTEVRMRSDSFFLMRSILKGIDGLESREWRNGLGIFTRSQILSKRVVPKIVGYTIGDYRSELLTQIDRCNSELASGKVDALEGEKNIHGYDVELKRIQDYTPSMTLEDFYNTHSRKVDICQEESLNELVDLVKSNSLKAKGLATELLSFSNREPQENNTFSFSCERIIDFLIDNGIDEKKIIDLLFSVGIDQSIINSDFGRHAQIKEEVTSLIISKNKDRLWARYLGIEDRLEEIDAILLRPYEGMSQNSLDLLLEEKEHIYYILYGEGEYVDSIEEIDERRFEIFLKTRA